MKRHLQEFLSLSESHNFDPRILEELSTHLEKLKEHFSALQSEQARNAELSLLRQKYPIPDDIMNYFSTQKLVEFIHNIEALPLEQIDWHILQNC